MCYLSALSIPKGAVLTVMLSATALTTPAPFSVHIVLLPPSAREEGSKRAFRMQSPLPTGGGGGLLVGSHTQSMRRQAREASEVTRMVWGDAKQSALQTGAFQSKGLQ